MLTLVSTSKPLTMHLLNNFGPLVFLYSLLALSFVPGIIGGGPARFNCVDEDTPGKNPGETYLPILPCSYPTGVCWINVETGKGNGCHPKSAEQCGTDGIIQDGRIYCAKGTKHCCCIDASEECNNHFSNSKTKAKICAVPELKTAKLCIAPAPGPDPAKPSSATTFSDFSQIITGTVAILTLTVL